MIECKLKLKSTHTRKTSWEMQSHQNQTSHFALCTDNCAIVRMSSKVRGLILIRLWKMFSTLEYSKEILENDSNT